MTISKTFNLLRLLERKLRKSRHLRKKKR